MSIAVILATMDPALAKAWEQQVAAGRPVFRLDAAGLPNDVPPGLAAVAVVDFATEHFLPPWLRRGVVILVGEPGHLAFEQARLDGRAKAYLSYEASHSRLRELLPMAEEIAASRALLERAEGKHRAAEPQPPTRRAAPADAEKFWDFVESAIEHLDTREKLVTEFRRASRFLLRASHMVLFCREADGFRADRGTSFLPVDDPLAAFFEQHPVVIDATTWTSTDPLVELAIRNRLALWGAQLLAPVHDNGRLLAVIALGVRDDGHPYDEIDRERVVFFARLLRHSLAKSAQISRLSHLAEQAALGAKYFPGTIVLAASESTPRHVPLVVREMIEQARRCREVCRLFPSAGQPFRASVGIVAETGGVWAFWEEASGEVHDTAVRERCHRRDLLREVALTLGHELGNALVSLAAFRQARPGQPVPPPLMEIMKSDVANLEALNENLALLQNLHETDVARFDLRDLAQQTGHALGLRVEVGPDPLPLSASRKMLDFALRALLRAIAENRPDYGMRELSLRLRATGEGRELTALFSLRGRHLELEGVLPEPIEGAIPTQGRIRVFLAKEIIRFHRGEIYAGPGIEGTEVLISIRSV